jgi:hypothetical protein
MQIDIHRAESEDYAGILSLQAENFIGNLKPADLGDGFLSAQFSLEQLEMIASRLGVMVARSNEDVEGFICAEYPGDAARNAIVARMLETFPQLTYEGKRLNEYRSFIYGPACVRRRSRGKGLLGRLYEQLKLMTAGKFELGVAFVSQVNVRSMRAHVEGLRMIRVGEFGYQDQVYDILVFKV